MDEVIEISGHLRELKNFIVFWPCHPARGNYKAGYPHFVISTLDTKSKLSKFLRKDKVGAVKFLGTISDEEIEGMDGTVVIHKIITVGDAAQC